MYYKKVAAENQRPLRFPEVEPPEIQSPKLTPETGVTNFDKICYNKIKPTNPQPKQNVQYKKNFFQKLRLD